MFKSALRTRRLYFSQNINPSVRNVPINRVNWIFMYSTVCTNVPNDLGIHFSISEVNISYGSVIPMERTIIFPIIYNS